MPFGDLDEDAMHSSFGSETGTLCSFRSYPRTGRDGIGRCGSRTNAAKVAEFLQNVFRIEVRATTVPLFHRLLAGARGHKHPGA